MSFFRQFPVLQYDTKKNGILNDTTDIFRHVEVNDVLIDDISTYTYYEILDGERPDIVSSRLYGTSDYHWTFFVANDSLKDGLNSWPLSNRQFEDWISDTYGNYSVMVFVPKYENGQYKNYFGGLNLTNTELIDNNNNSVEIKKFDIQSLQMWVNNPTGNILDQNNFKLCYKSNPYNVGEDAYDAYEEERQSWFKDIFEWCESNRPVEYNAYIDSNLYSQNDHELFYNNYFVNISFTAQHVYAKSYNAPKLILNADDEIISSYTAYEFTFAESVIQIEPYFRSTLEEDSSTYVNTYEKGNIEDVDAEYQNNYQVGYYTLLLTQDVKYVSYLEYEQERNFDKRKIKVIRKGLINEFVDRYKELIKS